MREAIARALLPHAYVSPFRCSCGWGVVRKLADESLESLFAQHQADAVLAVVRGVDADECDPVVASPDRCLTCRSDDRAVRLVVWGEPSYPDGVPEPYDCDNPWHRVPSTEPRSES